MFVQRDILPRCGVNATNRLGCWPMLPPSSFRGMARKLVVSNAQRTVAIPIAVRNALNSLLQFSTKGIEDRDSS